MQGDDDDDVSFDDETTLMPGRAPAAPKPPAAPTPEAAPAPAPIADEPTEEWEDQTSLLAPEAQARLMRAPALPFQPATPAPAQAAEEAEEEAWDDRTAFLTPAAQTQLQRAPALPFQPASGPAPLPSAPAPSSAPAPAREDTWNDSTEILWNDRTEILSSDAQSRAQRTDALPFAPTQLVAPAVARAWPPPEEPAPAPAEVPPAARFFHQVRREEELGAQDPPAEAPRREPAPPRHTDGIPILHDTPFAIATLRWLFQGRREMRSVIVKATCDLVPGEAARLREEAELPQGDVHRDDDPAKSLVYASDFVPQKPRVDVTLVGHAHARGGSAEVAVVRLRFGDPVAGGFERRVAVFGERRSERVLGAGAAGKPQPWTSVPLVYERAFGGPDFPDNPVGMGRDGKAAPQLEDPDRLIKTARDVASPACFAPISPRWPARAGKLGTFDARWLAERWPSLPADFDWAHWQAAPKVQQIASARGDEAFALAGVHPQLEVIEGRLPGVRPRVFADREGMLVEVDLRLDTVAFDANAMKVDLVFRGAIEVSDEEASEVAALFVTMEPLAGPATTLAEVDARYQARRAALEPVTGEPAAPAANDAAPDRFAPRQEAIQADLAAAGVASLGPEAARESADKPVERAAPPEADERRREVLARMATGATLAGLDLAEADLSGLDLSGQTLVRANLRGALLRGAKLEGADLSEAQLSESVLSEARAAGVTLARADLTGADLTGADLTGAAFEEADLSGARCAGAIFRGARGARARFAGSVVSRAVFDRAELSGADFTGAALDGARFEGAVMREVRLYDASGEGVVFDDADLEGARADALRLSGATLARLVAPRSVWDGATLPDARFVGARMPGASFARAACERASFDGADLRNANLRKARLAAASFEAADLMQASLESADLTGAVLRGANLYGAETWKAKIDKAELARAMVGKTKLEGRQS
ncbi:DUF2169 family type VI secretion system accessory protein [Polyangium aurulentum]|uniref:DUF2169 family type VI secretion system accessory protein n=1 Tax=Polyangium aurulentum TaxID=2567896 RepID=UPI00200C7248|nr:DUF2169 domain-containing protein [Polyangium aurulentum]UQA56919.1 DUF2169 domain-containing protein [Polyangium aurulentum]